LIEKSILAYSSERLYQGCSVRAWCCRIVHTQACASLENVLWHVLGVHKRFTFVRMIVLLSPTTLLWMSDRKTSSSHTVSKISQPHASTLGLSMYCSGAGLLIREDEAIRHNIILPSANRENNNLRNIVCRQRLTASVDCVSFALVAI
jgi:hypothetical protein